MPAVVESLLTPAEAAPAPQAPVTPTVVTSGLGYPLGLAVVPYGPVFVANFGSVDGKAPGRILAVDPRSGAVQVVLEADGYGPSDVKIDSARNIYFTDYGWDADDGAKATDASGRVVLLPASDPTNPTVLAAGLRDPFYLLVDERHQVLLVSDTGEADGAGDADPSGRVLSYPLTVAGAKVSLGAPSVVAGTGDPVANRAPLPSQPVPAGTPASEVTIFVAFGLAQDRSALYVDDEYAHVVYRVRLDDGTIGTHAGNGTATDLSGTGDGGPATSASVPYPQGLTVDRAGNLYILQIEGQVRQVDPDGTITTASTGPYVSDNVRIEWDPATDDLYYIGDDYPKTNNLYRVGLLRHGSRRRGPDPVQHAAPPRLPPPPIDHTR